MGSKHLRLSSHTEIEIIDNKSNPSLKKKKRRKATDGIDVHTWILNNEEIAFSLWDFAGQQLYYTSHQLFLSERAIYLVVFNITKDLSETRFIHWLNSIQVSCF